MRLALDHVLMLTAVRKVRELLIVGALLSPLSQHDKMDPLPAWLVMKRRVPRVVPRSSGTFRRAMGDILGEAAGVKT